MKTIAGAAQAVLLHGDAFARNRALYTADIAIQHAAVPAVADWLEEYRTITGVS
jgi:hypothetical protein